MHVIGLSCAFVLFLSLRKLEPWNTPPLKFAPAGAILALVVLVLGQIFGPAPQTHAEESGITMDGGTTPTVEPANGDSPGANPRQGQGQGRMVTLPNSAKSYHTGFMPHLGPPDAPHVIVKYFDYTCGACRDMHE